MFDYNLKIKLKLVKKLSSHLVSYTCLCIRLSAATPGIFCYLKIYTCFVYAVHLKNKNK